MDELWHRSGLSGRHCGFLPWKMYFSEIHRIVNEFGRDSFLEDDFQQLLEQRMFSLNLACLRRDMEIRSLLDRFFIEQHKNYRCTCEVKSDGADEAFFGQIMGECL